MRADFYGRKSSKDDGRSIDGQEADYRADCQEQGLEVGQVFAEPNRSASRYAKRPRLIYESLVRHIESGASQMVWLWEASRGSRDLEVWIPLLGLCRRQRVQIRIFTHERTYSPWIRRDYKTLAMEGVDSSDESDEISERTLRGKRQAAVKGRPASRLGYGFRRVYDERGNFVEQVEHPEQAPIVREIIIGLAAGKPSEWIADQLNDRGVPTPQADRLAAQGLPVPEHLIWSGRQVRQLAIKPSYIGKRVHQDAIIGDGLWKPVVDPVLWRIAHARLTTPGRKPKGDSRLTHWLAGAVECGLCGDTLRTIKRATGNVAYGCGHCFGVSASARGLEPAVEKVILARLRSADLADLFLPRRDDVALRAAEAEEAALRAQLDDLVVQAAKPKDKGGLSAAFLARTESLLQPQIDAAADRVRRLSLPPVLMDLAGVDVAGRWADLGAHIRRDVTRGLAHLVLDPGTLAGHRSFDKRRLERSRWVGQSQTWGELAQAAGVDLDG